jgi:hypothetical protein
MKAQCKQREGYSSKGLGSKGTLDGGEYCIRLALDRFVPHGAFTAAPLDLLGENSSVVQSSAVPTSVSVEWRLDTPPGTSVGIRLRTGPSPVPSLGGWSSWVTVSACEVWEQRAYQHRYLEFEAKLFGTALATPSLLGILVRSTAGTLQNGGGGAVRRVHSFDNQRVVRPSIQYSHEHFSALSQLRSDFALDELTSCFSSEFEKQLALMEWAYRVPLNGLNKYHWNLLDVPKLEQEQGRAKANPPYKQRRRDAHCLYSNLALIGACISMGMPARWVNISAIETYGHEVCEVW